MICPVVAYAPKAATKPSIAAQPLNFSASGVMWNVAKVCVKECNSELSNDAGGQPNKVVSLMKSIRETNINYYKKTQIMRYPFPKAMSSEP